MADRTLARMVSLASLAVLAGAPLGGCILAAAGAGAGGAYQLSGERSFTDSTHDSVTAAVIGQSWRKANPQMAEDLNTTVYQGRVLITGEVPSQDWRDQAVKLAWQADGVKEVYDEIQVGPEEGFTQDMGDATISNKLRAQLVGDMDVKSINYTVTTVHGVVYVIGSARSQAELNRVVDHARNISDVRRVVSYVRIRPGEAPKAEASSGPAPTASSPPPSAAPASAPQSQDQDTDTSLPTPRQQIDVTPLK